MNFRECELTLEVSGVSPHCLTDHLLAAQPSPQSSPAWILDLRGAFASSSAIEGGKLRCQSAGAEIRCLLAPAGVTLVPHLVLLQHQHQLRAL